MINVHQCDQIGVVKDHGIVDAIFDVQFAQPVGAGGENNAVFDQVEVGNAILTAIKTENKTVRACSTSKLIIPSAIQRVFAYRCDRTVIAAASDKNIIAGGTFKQVGPAVP